MYLLIEVWAPSCGYRIVQGGCTKN